MVLVCFFFQAEDGIRDLVRSRGLGDVYKRQLSTTEAAEEVRKLVTRLVKPEEDPKQIQITVDDDGVGGGVVDQLKGLSLIHI